MAPSSRDALPFGRAFYLNIVVIPQKSKNIDDEVNNSINGLTGPMAPKMIGPDGALLIGFQLERNEKINIDNHNDRRLLFSFSMINEGKEYDYAAIVYGDQYQYNITAKGKYDNLNSDLKTIDEIISSIKILK